MINLKANPFNLTDSQIEWVYKTLDKMTLEEKVGQLLCPIGLSSDENYLNHLINDLHVGALMYRPGNKKDIIETHRKIQGMAEIPLLLAANTESGGDGMVVEGTSFGKPMAVAATGSAVNAYRMGYTACSEGAAVGMNWSFAPIVDIDYNFHNPITNVRTFGSNPDKVLEYASQYLKAADENGVAVAIKHFPGDGCDERDQHLLTSINSLSTEDWDKTYGKIYGSLIEQGAKTVMVGHIAQPAYVEKINPDATNKEKLMPATLSKELVTGLLREKLHFNGLISTDASPMLGFTSAMAREMAVPQVIAAGCDMLLFNKNVDEDYRFMLNGVKDGFITEQRLNEAVTRILATKASLNLPEKKADNTIIPDDKAMDIIGCEEHKKWSEEIADEAVTLVKDTQKLLPLSTNKYKRIYLNVIQRDLSPENKVVQAWKKLFEDEGFEVILRNRTTTIEPENFAGINMTKEKQIMLDEMYRSVTDFRKSADLYVYIANIENASNNTTARLDWNVAFGLGDDGPWFAEEIPVLFISTANPYHLFDAPMMKTYINAYNTNTAFNKAVMDKIMGRSSFKGESPVDPFCGNKYLKMMAE